MPMPTTSPRWMRFGFTGMSRFIGQYRIAESNRRGSRKHVKPTRRNDGSAKRQMARIYEVNIHELRT
jgi:hypothetical protein